MPSSHARLRVLVVSFHFFPSPAIGAVRWSGLSSGLSELGHVVRVITASDQDRDRPFNSSVSLERVSPHYSTPFTDLIEAIHRLRPTHGSGETTEQEQNKPGGKKATTQPVAVRPRWRREVSALLGAPDNERSWVIPACRAAYATAQEWRPDVVVTTGPPHSSHLIGRLLKQHFRLHWLADLRDPIVFVPDEGSWFGQMITRTLERSIARSADQVLTTSPTLTRCLNLRYRNGQASTLPNGVIMDELPAPPRFPRPHFIMSHVGSIYGSRDMTPVIRAIHIVLRDVPEFCERMPSLHLAGYVPESQRLAIVKAQAGPLPEGFINYHGSVPRQEALSLVADSSISIVLAQDQHHSIPGKLYESTALGIPTLALTEKGSATWDMARSLGAWTVAPTDHEGIARVITQVLAGQRIAGEPTVNPQRLDYRVKAEELSSILNGLGITG